MQYRTALPQEKGFDSEEEELVTMRANVQDLMTYAADPAKLLDSVLVVACVCEQRALAYASIPPLADWYTFTALLLRQALEFITTGDQNTIRPDVKLENPLLYFPLVEDIS
jgi:hypothetical protein